MRTLFLVVALLLSHQVQAAKVMITGEKFVTELKSGDMAKMMHALGYFHAIEDVLEAGGHTCRPDGTATKSTMDGLTSYIQESTSSTVTPAARIITEYLIKTFPCSEPPTPQ